MARTNRIVIEDGLYHITARVAHRAMLLADPGIKDRIVDWIYGVADFSGVEVLTWCVMDNHLHLFVHVPPVPERYWLSSGTVPSEGPATPAFSMRSPECRTPRWQIDIADLERARRSGVPIVVSPAGDSPSEEAVRCAVADGVPVVTPPRPPTGFTMSDEEMVTRLRWLHAGHSETAADVTARRWARLRACGQDGIVEAEKDALCRRMYNVSQFMKTLKQRITQHFNSQLDHEGQLWDGRFYSGLVEDDRLARIYVAAYIDWNAPKAGLAGHPRGWRWCGYAVACGNGVYAARARAGYERIFDCAWEEAKSRIESVFAARLPESYDPARDPARCVSRGPDGAERTVRLTLAQLVKSSARHLFRGGFFARSPGFAEAVRRRLPRRFPMAGDGAAHFLSGCDWREPERTAA